jgi:thiamine biosynthesis lipoprotein
LLLSCLALFAISAALITAAVFLVLALPERRRSDSPPEAGEAEYRKFSSDSFDSFDTLVTFTAFARDETEFERYTKIVSDEMARLHRLFDIYHDYEGLANIKTINDMAGVAPVAVDPSIADLLEIMTDAYGYTGGAVNAALGPVLSIWRDYREAAGDAEGGAVPSIGELRAAAAHISPADILIDRDRSTVFLLHGGMRLDVGAAAKGYAAQKAAELVRMSGLRSGLINAGGNVVVIGRPLDGRETWNIGVHSPTAEGDMSKLTDVLRITGGAVVTSGNDQRYFTAGGRRYHHIIDPETLYPAENVKSVTVIHPDSAEADVLSTAAFILPLEKARELIERRGAEAMWVKEDGEKQATPGYLRLSEYAGTQDGQEEVR